MMKIDGGCHCGRIRYTAQIDPGRITICHCTDCQVLTGSAFRVSAYAKAGDLHIEGEPKVYVKRGDSGRLRNQYFCPDCGSSLLVNGGDEPGDWGIRWGGIRQRDKLKPTRPIWRRSAATWVCAFADAPASETE